jgi:hypothetical protein
MKNIIFVLVTLLTLAFAKNVKSNPDALDQAITISSAILLEEIEPCSLNKDELFYLYEKLSLYGYLTEEVDTDIDSQQEINEALLYVKGCM